jgi:excisionase family DNA binding protein
MSQMLNARQLGEKLGLSTWTVLEMARDGRLPCIRLGYRTVRFDLAEVERVLRERSTSRAAAPAGK